MWFLSVAWLGTWQLRVRLLRLRGLCPPPADLAPELARSPQESGPGKQHLRRFLWLPLLGGVRWPDVPFLFLVPQCSGTHTPGCQAWPRAKAPSLAGPRPSGVAPPASVFPSVRQTARSRLSISLKGAQGLSTPCSPDPRTVSLRAPCRRMGHLASPSFPLGLLSSVASC